MLQILLPAWTVCLDLFFTAIAYGISGIRIPVRAACILSGTGAGCFLAAMELAKWSGLFRSLSAREAFLLAAALSVDSLAVGIGIGWQDSMPVAIAGATLLFGILGVLCGTKIGVRLHRRQKRDYSWLSGACLLLLAVLQAVQ